MFLYEKGISKGSGGNGNERQRLPDQVSISWIECIYVSLQLEHRMIVFKLDECSFISSNQFIDQEDFDVTKKGDAMSTITIDGELSLLRADAEAIMNLIAEVDETPGMNHLIASKLHAIYAVAETQLRRIDHIDDKIIELRQILKRN